MSKSDEARRVADGLQRNPAGYADDAARILRTLAAEVERLEAVVDQWQIMFGRDTTLSRKVEEMAIAALAAKEAADE